MDKDTTPEITQQANAYVDFEIAIDSLDCDAETLLELIDGGEIISGYGIDQAYKCSHNYTSDLLEEAGLLDHEAIEVDELVDDTVESLQLEVRFPKEMEGVIIKRLEESWCVTSWDVLDPNKLEQKLK